MEKIRTTGVIIAKIRSEGDNVNYLVDVELNGEIVRARSIPYTSKGGYLPNNKVVAVDYYESPNGRNKIVDIIGENIIACHDDMGTELKVLKWFGIMVAVVIIIFIIKGLF